MSERITYAYVMVLEFPKDVLSESSGTVDLRPGMSRHDVFQQIRANMVKSAGEGPDATTVFWSLEKDVLS